MNKFLRITTASVLLFSIGPGQANTGCPNGLRQLFEQEALATAPRATTTQSREKDPFRKYRQYENVDSYARYKSKLLESIEYWSQVAQRDVRMRDLRRVRVRSFLREAMALDVPLVITEKLRPLFSKVQSSYYQVKRFKRLTDSLSRLQSGKNTADTRAELIRLEEKEAVDLTSLKQALEQNQQSFNTKLAEKIRELDNSSIELTLDIANHMDEYAEAVTFLQNVQKDSAASAEAKSKAQFVLDKLQGKYVADTFLARTHRPNEKTPTLEELNRQIDQTPIAEIKQLEMERSLERWTALASRVPTSELHLVIDKLLSRLPFLNKPAIRSFLRQSVDNRDVLAHYPNIDRMVEGGINTPKEMWDYTLIQDSKGHGTDSFLLTFARRSDARSAWRQILDYGKKRSEKLKENGHSSDMEIKLAEKMQRISEDAAKLPPLAPWHHPQKSAALRFLIDGLVIAGMAVAGSYAWDFFQGPPQTDDDNGDSSGIMNTLNSILENK